MSITFAIDNGSDYIRNNKPEMIEVERYDCQCVDFSENGKAEPDCRECKGSGEVKFDIFPFEMNVANGNAQTVMNSLGLDFDYCGEINPHRLLKAIQRTPVELACRQGSTDKGDRGCTIIRMGIDIKQANSYLTRLTAIAEEACKREEQVIWG